jgi:hypothetical protein
MKGPGRINDEWFGELWRNQFPCTAVANSTCSPQSLGDSQIQLQWQWPRICRVYDGVYVYATAMHKTIVNHCPEMFRKQPQQSTALKKCLNGVHMLSYLKVSAPEYILY